uniref:Pentatricopeptide repeat-containing protein n=1 Tax=Kalanchoe fedtschenkoi TaxID=63787 RepID=A0A7N0TWW9_KALFE
MAGFREDAEFGFRPRPVYLWKRSFSLCSFARCDSRFDDALRLFYDVPCDSNVVCWNAVISGAVRNGENEMALSIFSEMCSENLAPNSFTCSSILAACAAAEKLEVGKMVQGCAIKRGVSDTFVGTALIDLYAKGGEMGEAVKAFFCLPTHNVVSWTAVVSGFVRAGDSVSALNFFKKMRKAEEVNKYTLTSIISACATPVLFKVAMQVHSLVIKGGFYMESAVATALVNMYSKIGADDFTEKLFWETGDIAGLGSWANLISAFTLSGNSQRAIALLQKMSRQGEKPDEFCISSVLSVAESLHLGSQLHCYTLKTGLCMDVAVGSSLFTMYSKCGSFEDSITVFETMECRDVVALASMIAGFVEHGCADEALVLFRDISSESLRLDGVILSSVLTACSALQLMKKGKEAHGHAIRAGLDADVQVASALVTMYSKCGSLKPAKKVFDALQQKDSAACSSLVSGYANGLRIDEALLLFREIRMSGLAVDSFTVSSILGAAALSDRPTVGTQAHALAVKLGLDSESSVGSSLITLYSTRGTVSLCRRVFDKILRPDVIAWTSMIQSYAQHGNGAEALRIFDRMKEAGTDPDAVTFVSVLSVCSRSGLVEEGFRQLNSMVRDYGIRPGSRHYACLVDALGRAGRLEEAEEFMRNLPVEPDAVLWGTLLASCKLHGDVELGKMASEKVVELEPSHDGAHISLSNIYADLGEWDRVEELRGRMRQIGARKLVAWSSM